MVCDELCKHQTSSSRWELMSNLRLYYDEAQALCAPLALWVFHGKACSQQELWLTHSTWRKDSQPQERSYSNHSITQFPTGFPFKKTVRFQKSPLHFYFIIISIDSKIQTKTTHQSGLVASVLGNHLLFTIKNIKKWKKIPFTTFFFTDSATRCVTPWWFASKTFTVMNIIHA